MSAISFQHVSKLYQGARGVLQALKDVSFEIEPGEFFGLLGPNGAGKTTLISILAGLTHATGGQVRVHGYDVVSQYAQARRQLGIVPQELVFDPFFTVREALRIQSGYFGVRRNDDWIDELLANLGLADKANANMRQLSGGMKRRVLVAQALVHRPPVIVLDEPTAGVDAVSQAAFAEALRAFVADGGTVLLVAHELGPLSELVGRAVVVHHGTIAHDGAVPVPAGHHAEPGHDHVHPHGPDQPVGMWGK